jgi:DNA-binding MarR family transcriptional regulator
LTSQPILYNIIVNQLKKGSASLLRDVHIYFNKLDRIAHMFINDRLKDTELSRGLFFYILELSHQDGVSLQKLSRMVFVDKANTTRAVAKLTELGYVFRKENECDLRSSKIFLTQLGKNAAIKIEEIFLEWRNLISDGLTDNEQKIVLDISNKLYENAYKYYCSLDDKK